MTEKEKKKYIPNPHKDRSLVLRFRAGQNIVITLMSFAFSVAATRLFLELTGYPKLGGGELHIAHVLWGGLLLFAAALIPIIFVNDWAVTLSALIAGLGVGLFIDEVGKFITSTNDYFHPSAAPIVYVFFLLTVLLAFQVRQNRPKSTRSRMYEILEHFSEVLDRDLSAYEREKMIQSLSDVIKNEDRKDLCALAESMLQYLQNNNLQVKNIHPNFLDRMKISMIKFERKFLSRPKLKLFILIGMVGSAVWSLISPVFFFSISKKAEELQVFYEELFSNRLVRNLSGLNWFEARVLMEGSLALVILAAAFLFLIKKEKLGTWLGMISLILAITMVNLLVFYFEQFSTILLATFQFLVLVLIMRYRKRFILTH
ncbi:MAG: hypothetical protein CVU42_13600 [Chloroflexi bacterium HGW-Chloroflexi-4]|jgi:hypothetical protein|nr:MAG: hypothetical protein CVU42_13600 [Chloroflexi bacterium HGW-Chloroflexi-4]